MHMAVYSCTSIYNVAIRKLNPSISQISFKAYLSILDEEDFCIVILLTSFLLLYTARSENIRNTILTYVKEMATYTNCMSNAL